MDRACGKHENANIDRESLSVILEETYGLTMVLREARLNSANSSWHTYNKYARAIDSLNLDCRDNQDAKRKLANILGL